MTSPTATPSPTPPPPTSPLVESRTLGSLTLHAIQAGPLRLDGGAMFGVVPKPLWEKRVAPDVRNRIPLGMRCLLVEHPGGLVLIDTGAGNKDDAKFREIYAIDDVDPDGRTALEAGLAQLGYTPDDVDLVVNTHLHFDHAGGNTVKDANGVVVPTFPRARYVVQNGELHFATKSNERTAASYLPPNFQPLAELGKIDEVVGEVELLPGIITLPTPGHTPFHQSVLIESDGEVACFLGDVVPTSHHLPLPWIMGYDLEPMVTLESKRWVLRRGREEGWLMIFEHDASVAWDRIAHDGKAYGLESVLGADAKHPAGGGPETGKMEAVI